MCASKDDEVLMEHLIVGVLLFTPLLALMPTSVMFGFFVFCLQFLVIAVRCILAFLMNLFICNPLMWITLRFVFPSLFPGNI